MTATTASAQDANARVEKYKDWTIQCGAQSKDDTQKRCVMGQLVTRTQEGSDKSAPLMQVLVIRSEDKKQARLVFKLPLYTLLPAGVALTIDKGKAMNHQYRFCDPEGCSVIVDLDKALLGAFRRGSKARLQFASTLGGQGEVPVSLSGFTAAYNRLGKIKP